MEAADPGGATDASHPGPRPWDLFFGGEAVIICRGDDLTWGEQKTTRRHGVPPWAGASGLSRAAKSCS